MDFYNIIQNELKVYINTIIMRVLFEGDKYGYEICKEIETRTHGQFKMKQPTLYSTLKRLEAQGFIKSYEDESLTHGGKRRYYSLTDLGTETFVKSQSDWEYSRTVMDRLISDKDADLDSLPPVEPVKRLSRPKAKKAVEEQTEEKEELTEEETIEDEIIEIAEDAEQEKADNLDEIFINESANESAPEPELKPADTYMPLYSRPAEEAAFAAYGGGSPSYTDDLRNQVFVADAATAMNINDADFTSLYSLNPYDSADTAPIDDEDEPAEQPAEIADADNGADERKSDAVFLPPPDFEQEPKRNAAGSALFDNDIKELSESEQAQNYIDVEYKNILTRFIRFNIDKSAAVTVAAAASKPARVQSSDGLDDIRVRQHDKSANLQYTKKFYVYINRLSLMKNAVVSAVMLAETLIFFLVFDLILGRVIQAEKWFYAPAIIVSCLPAVYSLIAYAINPDRKKRISNSYFENLLIYIFVAAVAVLAIYLTCGWAGGMNLNNIGDFYARLGLSAALALNFILSAVIFSILHRTRKYAV